MPLWIALSLRKFCVGPRAGFPSSVLHTLLRTSKPSTRNSRNKVQRVSASAQDPLNGADGEARRGSWFEGFVFGGVLFSVGVRCLPACSLTSRHVLSCHSGFPHPRVFSRRICAVQASCCLLPNVPRLRACQDLYYLAEASLKGMQDWSDARVETTTLPAVGDLPSPSQRRKLSRRPM